MPKFHEEEAVVTLVEKMTSVAGEIGFSTEQDGADLVFTKSFPMNKPQNFHRKKYVPPFDVYDATVKLHLQKENMTPKIRTKFMSLSFLWEFEILMNALEDSSKLVEAIGKEIATLEL